MACGYYVYVPCHGNFRRRDVRLQMECPNQVRLTRRRSFICSNCAQKCHVQNESKVMPCIPVRGAMLGCMDPTVRRRKRHGKITHLLVRATSPMSPAHSTSVSSLAVKTWCWAGASALMTSIYRKVSNLFFAGRICNCRWSASARSDWPGNVPSCVPTFLHMFQLCPCVTFDIF